jgi:hypothetical protein
MKTLKRIARDITPEAARMAVKPIIRKSVLLAIAFMLLALASLSRAQTQEFSVDSMIQVMRSGIQADRATIISMGMNFNQKDGATFWPVYRQYEYERSGLEDRRLAVLKEYSEKYTTLNDADAKSMAERMFDYDARMAELKKKYYKKFNKQLSALTVTKFFQLDRRIDLMVDVKVESSLPPLTQAQYTGNNQ